MQVYVWSAIPNLPLSGVWPAPDLAWSRSQAVEHNFKQVVPGVEGKILNERPQVFEAGLARGQLGAQRPIALVQAVENGVYQIGQEDQGSQYGGQMRLAMAVVVLEVVALSLKETLIYSNHTNYA